jgi:hypothetical protein
MSFQFGISELKIIIPIIITWRISFRQHELRRSWVNEICSCYRIPQRLSSACLFVIHRHKTTGEYHFHNDEENVPMIISQVAVFLFIKINVWIKEFCNHDHAREVIRYYRQMQTKMLREKNTPNHVVSFPFIPLCSYTIFFTLDMYYNMEYTCGKWIDDVSERRWIVVCTRWYENWAHFLFWYVANTMRMLWNWFHDKNPSICNFNVPCTIVTKCSTSFRA